MTSHESAQTGLLLTERRADLPGSCTNMVINLTELAGFMAAIYVFTLFPEVDPVLHAAACISTLVAPVAVLELIFLKIHRRTSIGLDFSVPQPRKPSCQTLMVQPTLLIGYARPINLNSAKL